MEIFKQGPQFCEKYETYANPKVKLHRFSGGVGLEGTYQITDMHVDVRLRCYVHAYMECFRIIITWTIFLRTQT